MKPWSTFQYGNATKDDFPNHPDAKIRIKNKEREEIAALTNEYLKKNKITVIPYGVRKEKPSIEWD